MGTTRRRAARWIVAAVAAAALAAPAAPAAAAAPVWNDPATVIRGGCGYGGNSMPRWAPTGWCAAS